MRILVWVMLLLFTVPQMAAEPRASVEQLVAGYASLAAQKCASRGKLEQQFIAQGKLAEAHSTRLGEDMICGCVPNGVQQLAQGLSKAELASMVSEQEFTQRYLAQVLSYCSVAQFRATYADGCAAAFTKTRANSAKYCACMQEQVQALDDALVLQIGSESASYIEQAGKAKQQGLPLPAKPASVQRYSAMNAACAAP